MGVDLITRSYYPLIRSCKEKQQLITPMLVFFVVPTKKLYVLVTKALVWLQIS